MANETVFKQGIISKGNVIVTGSATATLFIGPITGSHFGTSSWATNTVSSLAATSASFATTAATASLATNAINAQTASFLTLGTCAITSSWANNATTAGSATSASFATNASTASFLLGAVVSASFATTAANLNGFIFNNTSSVLSNTASNVVVDQKNTASFTAAFFDYTANSQSNARAGTIFGCWNGATISYTEYANVDIGDTSQVTMSIDLSASFVRLLANASTDLSWNIKAIGRFI